MSTHHLMRHIFHTFPYKILTHQTLSTNNINARYEISQMLCCNLWMTVNSVFATYGSPTKCNCTLMALSTSRTREFGEAKYFRTFILAFTKNNVMDCGFLQRNNSSIISRLIDKCCTISWNSVRYVGIHTSLEDRSNVSWFMQDGASP